MTFLTHNHLVCCRLSCVEEVTRKGGVEGSDICLQVHHLYGDVVFENQVYLSRESPVIEIKFWFPRGVFWGSWSPAVSPGGKLLCCKKFSFDVLAASGTYRAHTLHSRASMLCSQEGLTFWSGSIKILTVFPRLAPQVNCNRVPAGSDKAKIFFFFFRVFGTQVSAVG